MDDEMRDKAREVFTELTTATTAAGGSTLGSRFEHVFNNDFASWRVFFRAIKDLTADPESALAELSGNGFLARTGRPPGTARDQSRFIVNSIVII